MIWAKIEEKATVFKKPKPEQQRVKHVFIQNDNYGLTHV